MHARARGHTHWKRGKSELKARTARLGRAEGWINKACFICWWSLDAGVGSLALRHVIWLTLSSLSLSSWATLSHTHTHTHTHREREKHTHSLTQPALPLWHRLYLVRWREHWGSHYQRSFSMGGRSQEQTEQSFHWSLPLHAWEREGEREREREREERWERERERERGTISGGGGGKLAPLSSQQRSSTDGAERHRLEGGEEESSARMWLVQQWHDQPPIPPILTSGVTQTPDCLGCQGFPKGAGQQKGILRGKKNSAKAPFFLVLVLWGLEFQRESLWLQTMDGFKTEEWVCWAGRRLLWLSPFPPGRTAQVRVWDFPGTCAGVWAGMGGDTCMLVISVAINTAGRKKIGKMTRLILCYKNTIVNAPK